MAAVIKTTAYPMLGGADAYAGVGGKALITVGGTWVTGDTFLIGLNATLSAVNLSLGAGPLTGQTVNFLLTYDNKLNLLWGTTWGFSAVGSPLVVNDPNGFGNSTVSLTDAFSEAQDAKALAPFQGKIAVFGSNNIQIWQTDADPAGYALVQVLENIGAIASLSVKSFGELDVFFLHNTGFRSLRVRDASSNGLTIDVGSPIDSIIQDQVIAASATQRAAACGVIDTTNSQYWCFLKDTIYVLSLFPSAKISAWSEWKPTYQSASYSKLTFLNSVPVSCIIKLGLVNDVAQATQTYTVAGLGTQTGLGPANYLWVYNAAGDALVASHIITGGMLFTGRIEMTISLTFVEIANQTVFTPQKFVTHNGQVIARGSDGFYVYGGADRNTYDNSICVFETSWLDFDSPAVEKNFFGVDVAQTGSWNHYASSDYLSQTLQQIMLSQANPTFAGGKIGWTNTGSHVKYRGQTDGTAAKAVISNLLVHYKGNNQR